MIQLAQIELIYLSIFSLITMITILTYTEKMSIGIGLMSIIFGSIICYIFAPYMQMIISPIGNWIIYNYNLSYFVMAGLLHIFSLVFLVGIAIYNLIVSGGKISWA